MTGFSDKMLKMQKLGPALLLLFHCNYSVRGQISGERIHPSLAQMFSSVDSDLNENIFENFVDFGQQNYGVYEEYEDQMPSESVLTEDQLSARQMKLRELYKARRPVKKDGSPKFNFFNRFRRENKTEEEAEKVLDIHSSGQAVTVVMPPPDFKPSAEDKKVVDRDPQPKTTLEDWNNKQKQRAALATSLIGEFTH